MSTYKIIDYVRRVKTYVVVFSHGGTEHKLEVSVHLNTDGTIHIEHTKNKISRWIIDYKAELKQPFLKTLVQLLALRLSQRKSRLCTSSQLGQDAEEL